MTAILFAVMLLFTSCATAEPPSNAVLPCTGYDAALLAAHLERLGTPEYDVSRLLGASMPHYAPMMRYGADNEMRTKIRMG